jgi:hypothetical protein
MLVDLGYDVIDKAKKIQGRIQKRIPRRLFLNNIVRITILGLTTTIKMVKSVKKDLGWPQSTRGPPFSSLGTHTHDRREIQD